ncbi:3-hydroxy-3-methylglutaryl-coenzyme A reductase [Cyberlindnera fabianii]|uniref:3-hydroxy-3-methylglutaryl coenzyme A reductase n=1 Tax=Cyberlindnera fabianii TaxID=36022 RepID=A0A1V2LCM8_CYBFA|nr:3-hydroxy-3-methylglutaryl-coenzyme A reductase [Cyberlindnera fabianii]
MSLLEAPLRGITTVLALISKLSARHPIHAIVFTSLAAAICYLNVVQLYYLSEGFTYDEDTNVEYYYHTAGSWFAIDDLSKVSPDAAHFDVIPFEFSRAGEHELPQIQDAFTRADDDLLKFVIIPEGPESHKLTELKQLTAEDGTVWNYRNYHAKLGKYSDLAVRAYDKVMKLIQGAETFDIALVTLAYIAMYYTFISLFIKMRSIGSKFWLAFCALISSVFAFLFALYITTKCLCLNLTLLSLSEGLPFFVATIGFNNKVALAQRVFNKYTSKKYSKEDTSVILYDSVKEQGATLLRDHILMIVAFIGCSIYASHLESLKNFCVFAALILSFDIFTTVTFYAGILSLKLEINLIHNTSVLKQALEEDGLTETAVDDILKSNSVSGAHYKSDNALLTVAKTASILVFAGLHFYGFNNAWFSDFARDFDESVLFYDTVVSHIPTDSNDVLVSVHATRFFLPEKLSIKVENVILATISHISVAVRDKYISKVALFGLICSLTINIYLLNAARIHSSSIQQDIELKKPSLKKKSTKTAVTVPSPASTETKDEETTKSSEILHSSSDSESEQPIRPLDVCVQIMKDGKTKTLQNEEVINLATNGKLPLYALEKQLGDNTRAVAVRRKAIAKLADAPVLATNKLPYLHYDYDRVFGACCENVIGYMPVPVGIAGPLIIDSKPYHIPMATTEGCLVASAMRGCKAINLGGGVTTVLTKDGMTRGPCVRFPSLARAGACKIWLDSEEGQNAVKKAFNSTSRFARLQHIQTAMAGDLLFIRFRTTTGDAMGMNMISKGVEYSLKQMVEELGWDDMDVVSVSGNYCIDKKPAAINWIEGRGKSVVAEAIIPQDAVVKVLKSDVKALVDLNINKNLVGSAMAGSVGGFNAQASNFVTALYLALGQDPAQNVESSNCITLMNETADGDLKISVSMPSIEVGTIGGGTILDPQGSMLELLGVRGPADVPGDNARQLAKIIASTVLAGELSLCSALAAGHLVQSHMQHNRAAPAKK